MATYFVKLFLELDHVISSKIYLLSYTHNNKNRYILTILHFSIHQKQVTFS